MVVRSWKDGVRAVISITLLSVLGSVLIAWGIAMLLDKKLELVFAVAVPAMGVPFFVIPLVRANLRLYQTRAELERLVRTDSLTGLANRRSFLEQATSLFSSPAADKDDIAVMMVDIDHFKRINDSCGHDRGDRVLKLVANAIVSVALQEHPGQALVGRIGGEEFVVLAHGVDASGAVALAEKLCQVMRRLECSKYDHVMVPTVSIGVAMRNAGETFAQVLKAADIAVYEAKALGRDRWCIAHRDIDALAKRDIADGQHRAGEGVTPRRSAGLTAEAGAVALRGALPA
jgi:diguanylate cyclase (GGDEF)-like protein